ncbi:MAG: ferrochelatase [bacterium]
MNNVVDIVLATYGEPSRNSFFEQWVYSNRILNRITRRVAPIPSFAVPLIGAYRAWRRTREWAEARYVSPMEAITEKQRIALADSLSNLEPNKKWRVHIGYQFRTPSLLEQLQQICQKNSGSVLLIPMYTPRSDFTSGLCTEDINTFTADDTARNIQVKIIHLADNAEKLADVMASFVKTELLKRGHDLDRSDGKGLILSAHGTILTPIKGLQETGYKDTVDLWALLKEQLAVHFEQTSIGWLNHRKGGEWTPPSLEEAIAQMKAGGINDFVYFPFGFVADNEETVLTGRLVFENLGIAGYTHLPCVNDDREFIRFLAEKVVEECKSNI